MAQRADAEINTSFNPLETVKIGYNMHFPQTPARICVGSGHNESCYPCRELILGKKKEGSFKCNNSKSELFLKLSSFLFILRYEVLTPQRRYVPIYYTQDDINPVALYYLVLHAARILFIHVLFLIIIYQPANLR